MNPVALLNLLSVADALIARGQAIYAGMRDAVAEGRDLNDEEKAKFKADAELADQLLGDAIERKRQREAEAGKQS